MQRCRESARCISHEFVTTPTIASSRGHHDDLRSSRGGTRVAIANRLPEAYDPLQGCLSLLIEIAFVSDNQYDEFQTIDRPLTDRQMQALREGDASILAQQQFRDYESCHHHGNLRRAQSRLP